MGVSEIPAFANGTIAVCKAAAENEGAFTVIGGGDSAAAAKKLGFASKFSHVSTGGGASLELIQTMDTCLESTSLKISNQVSFQLR